MMESTDTPGSSTAESLLAEASAHHRAGRLDEAEPLYHEALRLAPGHWRIANNLGALYLAKQQPTRALGFLETALETAPDPAPVWPSFASGLMRIGEFERAEAVLQRFASDPRAPQVELHLRQAWGAALMKRIAPDQAAVQFRRALEMAPDSAEAHGDLGYALALKGDFAEAEEVLRGAVELAPDNVGVRLNLGSTLLRRGRLEAAEAEYRAALALEPGNGAAIQNLRALLERMGRGVEAEALAQAPGSAPMQALAAQIRGQALLHRGLYEESLAEFDRAVALAPDNAGLVYERAFLRLLVRDFAGGWRDYEMRWRMDRFVDASSLLTDPPIHHRFNPELTAGDLAGRRVLVIAEQGVGDHIMFASLLPDLMRTAARATLVCDPRLVRLFRASFPGLEVTGPDEADIALGDYEVILPLGGLARLYRDSEADFPGVPYLSPAPQARERWAERLGPRTARRRIGVSWQGGVRQTGRARRSLSLEEMRPVLDLPDCEFVSLQYGDVTEEVAAFNAGRAQPVRLFPREEIDDFEELAGLVANLDVVVSVQTALVHLCGAIGQRALVLIPHYPEWRYTARGDTMPWYGSVRLFRQETPGDWADPLARIVDELTRNEQGPGA